MSMKEDILAARYYKNGETSRAEVYKRVADFIGDSDEERETYFNMMNEDKFLPNSPTLMNAGATDEPFMSACVVLDVQDNMESIFGAVKNAAVCHQRGAGCIASGSMVFTKRGIIPIDAVKVGDKVWAIDQKTGKQDFKNVTDIHEYGVDDKNIVQVYMKGTCNTVITSDYHPFTVLNDKDEIVFIEAKDLKPDMKLLIGTTESPSKIVFGKSAFNDGIRCANPKKEFNSVKSYTESYILSFLAGVFRYDKYSLFNVSDDFSGTFEEYLEKIYAQPGTPIISFVHPTYSIKTANTIAALCSRMGIFTAIMPLSDELGYSVYVQISMGTAGHKMLSFMYPAIKYVTQYEIKQNYGLVDKVVPSSCSKLCDLTVEDYNTYLASTMGMPVFIHNTGFSFNELRPKGSLVHSSQGKASGPISFMEVFDKATSVVSQGGSRRGANMGIINIDHPDAPNFICCKEEEGKIQNFNISVMITDKFMEDVIDGKYDEVVSTSIDGTTNTVGSLWKLVTEHAWRNGEPGVLFYDTINRDNTVPHLGDIKSTNPCSELPLLPYESCTLGSINLSKFVKPHRNANGYYESISDFIDTVALSETVCNAINFLDKVVSKNVFPLPELKDMAERTRKIGLGVMGYADMLLKLNIPYDSDKALSLIDDIMDLFDDNAFSTSQELGELKGTYPEFKPVCIKDRNGKFPYKRNFNCHYKIGDGKIEYRNANITTIAPTGTISLLADCSSGIEPVFSYVYKRKNVVGNEYMVYHPIFKEKLEELFPNDTKKQEYYLNYMYEHGSIQDCLELPEYTRRVFKTALDIDPEWHIKTQAQFQSWITSSISKTINMPESATVEDVGNAIKMAYELGCKGLTIYRTNSRNNVVLNLGDKKEESSTKESANNEKKHFLYRRETDNPLSGRTYNIQSGCCKLYVTINHDTDNNIREVFVSNSGGSGCTALLGSLGRIVSLDLKKDYTDEDFDRLISGLTKTVCAACVKNRDAEAKSCSAAVAKCLKRENDHLKSRERVDIPTINVEEIAEKLSEDGVNTWKCPECGAINVDKGGCVCCSSCGYSKCA